MKQKMRCLFSQLLVAAMIVFPSLPAQSSDGGLSGEVTPYFWAPGFKGGVSIGNRTANRDTNFSDTSDHLKGGASFLASVDYKRFVGYLQGDWLNLRWDRTSSALGNASLRTHFVDSTLAGGYRINSFYEGAHVDLMAGVQYSYLGSELNSGAFPEITSNRDLFDGVFVMRPWFPFLKRWSFSPTWSVGGGKSDVTYTLSPQFQYQFTDSWVARLGYRRVYYRVHSDNGRFDGYFHGLMLGVGWMFGNSGAAETAAVPAPVPVSMMVSPALATVHPKETLQFEARTTGMDNQNVTWSVDPALGSISASGLYTAPDTIALPETVTIKATNQADATKISNAILRLAPPPNAPKTVSITMNVLFDHDKTVVKPEYDSEIVKVADFMKMYPHCHAEIDGHSDQNGGEAHNLDLSTRRAQAIRDVLVKKHDIEGSRVTARGFGEAMPAAPNETAEGRAQNRRVVAVLSAEVNP